MKLSPQEDCEEGLHGSQGETGWKGFSYNDTHHHHHVDRTVLAQKEFVTLPLDEDF
jgi:hypothetical protein